MSDEYHSRPFLLPGQLSSTNTGRPPSCNYSYRYIFHYYKLLFCGICTLPRYRIEAVLPVRFGPDQFWTSKKKKKEKTPQPASSERAFSALKRTLKTYLRATMTQKRLNHAMMLHVNKDKIDQINPKDIGNLFVAGSEYRLQIFGKFWWVYLLSIVTLYAAIKSGLFLWCPGFLEN